MLRKATMNENDLAVLAKEFRKQADRTRAQAARDMKVSQTSIFNAEETPDQSLVKLRVRMIGAYSPYRVVGGLFFVERKPKKAGVPRIARLPFKMDSIGEGRQ